MPAIIFFFIINQLHMECYLGNDVSKGYADIVVLGPDLVPLEDTLQFDDTRDGHTLFQGWIEALFEQHGITLLNCAVESTGGLENNWHAMLVGLSAKLPLRVARLNPSTVKDAAKAERARQAPEASAAAPAAAAARTRRARPRRAPRRWRPPRCRTRRGPAW